MVYGLWFMVYGLWFMVYGLGCRIKDERLKVVELWMNGLNDNFFKVSA